MRTLSRRHKENIEKTKNKETDISQNSKKDLAI